MEIRFIGQGVNDSESVGQRLLEAFSNGLYEKFTAISAFATQIAVLGTNEILQKSDLKSSIFIVGVDQKGTSKEALEALLLIENADVSIVHTTTSLIFHPKIYIFEGQEQCSLIIGSSNLTSSGLFQNIEASLMLEFERSNVTGMALLSDIKKYLDALSNNRKPLTQELIDSLVESKIVPLEKETRENRGKQYDDDNSERDPSVWAQIKTVFPSIKRQTIPSDFRFKKVKMPKEATETVDIEEFVQYEVEKGQLVWQKHNLPSSDAQQVKGNTNVTGVLRLGQADYKIKGELIDKNTYFRQTVFGALNWIETPRKNNSPLQEARTEFDVFIDNQYFGTTQLRVSHDPERISGQANIPTTIHWGTEVVTVLKNNNVVGKRLSLYMPIAEGEPFTLEIL